MIILFVDDDVDNVQMFSEALKRIDATFRCIVAYNGKQALDILQTGLVPDYIFLDINMQVMNGKETLKALRKERRYRKVPVIMYSTAITPDEITSYKKEGATRFLIKAGKLQDICLSLEKIISRATDEIIVG
ncbi:MAG TPA: response regulator [Chryseosolibacter sp.]